MHHQTLRITCLALGLAFLGSSARLASAATLIWDSNGTTNPTGQDGAGDWLGQDRWWDANANSNVTWANTGQDSAILGNGGMLGSASSTLILGQDVRVKDLIFAPLHASNTQAYVLQNGSLNFGTGGRIEIRDGSSSAGNNHRIMMQSQMRGTDVTVQSGANANLALIHFTGANQWTGTLTLDGTRSTSNHGLFTQFGRRNTLNTLDKVVVKTLSTAALSEAGTYQQNWEISGSGAGSRGAIRFDANATVTGELILSGNASLGLNANVSTILEGNIGESSSGSRLTLSVQSGGNSGRNLTLRGNNTFTGGFTLDGGVVRLESAGALNAAGVNDLTFQATPTSTAHERILILGGYDLTVAGLNAAATASNSIIRNDAFNHVTLTVKSSGTHTYSGTLQDGTDTGKLALTVTGGAILNLSNANTYSGVTTIETGSLRISHAQALGGGDAGVIVKNSLSNLRLSNNIHVENTHFQGSYLINTSGNNTWSGTVQTLSGMQTTIESASGNLLLSGTLEGKSLVNTDHTINLVGAGTGEVSGVIQNVYQLNKFGSGSWLLSGLNQYSKATQISSGNLQVGKNSMGQTGTGDVIIHTASGGAAAHLSGSGFVRGATTLNNGKILAGDQWGSAMGTLHFVSSLNLNSNSAATVGEFTLGNQGEGDQWVINSDLSINHLSQLAVLFDTSYVLSTGDSWTLIDLEGNFLPGAGFDWTQQLILPDLSLLAGYDQHQWSVSDLNHAGTLTVSIIAVPEPSKAWFGMIALGGLVTWRRRSH